jgi:DNA-binding transcriptional LysR family regulator
VLPQVIAAFARRFPAVTFDVRISNDTVDLVTEGIDLAFRGSSRLPDSTLIARRLARGAVRLYASPSYVARRGTPSRYGDPEHAWILFRRGPEGTSPIEAPVVRCDDLQLTRELIAQGLGVGILPPFVAQSRVADGQLVALGTEGPEHPLAEGGLYLVYPSRGHLPPKVTAFRDFVLAGLHVGRDGSVRWTL